MSDYLLLNTLDLVAAKTLLVSQDVNDAAGCLRAARLQGAEGERQTIAEFLRENEDGDVRALANRIEEANYNGARVG